MCAGADGTQFAGTPEEPVLPLDLSVRPGTESLTPDVIGRGLKKQVQQSESGAIA